MPESDDASVSLAESRRILARVIRLFRPYRGLVEARCEDGIVLSAGGVVRAV